VNGSRLIPYLAPRARQAILLPFLMGGLACSSIDSKPDAASLLQSIDCAIVLGQYRVESEEDGIKLATRIFGAGPPLAELQVSKSSGRVHLQGTTTLGEVLKKDIVDRFSCGDSVLTLLLKDEAGTSGIVTYAESMKLELFATEATVLKLRFIDSEFMLFFLVPVFREREESFVLERVEVN